MRPIFAGRRGVSFALLLGAVGILLWAGTVAAQEKDKSTAGREQGQAAGPIAGQEAAAQPKFEVKPLAEKKVKELPPGQLYWLVENFPTLEKAQAAAGATSLAVEAAGKAWLFTLAPHGASAHEGAGRVAEIGPVAPVSAPEYLLRINNAGGPPGAKTAVHTHPGSETFYVVTGQLTQKTPHGVMQVGAGQAMPGHGPDMPMQVSSSGAGELNALVMFVVDATRPFSSPAKME